MNQNREIKKMDVADLLVPMKFSIVDSILNWNLPRDK